MDMDTDDDPLRYDKWIEEALRSVIRRALELAAKEGLPGDHHFYITFATATPDVQIPDYLKAQHPDEMTIVLQHQFEDLTIEDDYFSVVVRFKGKPENLVIPYYAVTAFADPAVNFGLQLKLMSSDDEDIELTGIDDNLMPASGGNDSDAEGYADQDDGKAVKDAASGDNVITLDAFRKK